MHITFYGRDNRRRDFWNFQGLRPTYNDSGIFPSGMLVDYEEADGRLRTVYISQKDGFYRIYESGSSTSEDEEFGENVYTSFGIY